jgi:hypothetical protein
MTSGASEALDDLWALRRTVARGLGLFRDLGGFISLLLRLAVVILVRRLRQGWLLAARQRAVG